MSEEKTTIVEQELLTEIMPETDGVIEEPQAELSELDKAVQARMGHFTITISPADLRYVKNLLNNKIEWKGPNEAYLILMALLSISSELKERDSSSTERVQVQLPSTTLESINFFLNRVTGKGEETAHRLFAVSMLLRPAIEEIKKLDEIIEKLQSEEK
jgi:hypothetical protein